MSIFNDKIAFVTGGGSGLGQALCEELARRGAVVIVTDKNIEAAARVAEGITSSGGRALPTQIDVTQMASVRNGIDRAISQYGRLDYIFNNAGIIVLGEIRDMEEEHWRNIFEVNLFGVIHGTTAAYAQMIRQGYGHIINIASVGGLVPLPTYAAYSATKYAVVGLSTSMREEARRFGVKISVVCPGTMKTGMGASATILRASRAKLEGNSRSQNAMDAAVAARTILYSVERNRRIIVFPLNARLLWWLYRIQPALLAPLESWFVKALRAARTES